jgi:hypothetical protein
VSYTATTYLKAAANPFIRIQNDAAGFGTQVGQFNLTAVTASAAGGATAASITPAGNGWFRCSVTFISTGAFTSVGLKLYPTDAGGNGNIAGTGTDSFYVWGAQTELGSFATSYIPTVASTVTRAADIATMTGTNFSDWYNQSEGTLVSEAVSTRPVGDTTRLLAASDGTANNSIRLNVATIPLAVVVAGVTEASFTLSTVANAANKYALGYKANDVNGAVNGVVGTTDTSASIPVVDRLEIGRLAAGGSGNLLCGYIRSITFYPQRLANAQLQALTS